MFRLTALAAALAAVLSVSTAPAQNKKKADPPFDAAKAFKGLDTDKNGKLDPKEFDSLGGVMKLPPIREVPVLDLSKVFTKADKNSDGFLDKDEFKGVPDAMPVGKKKAK